MKSVPDRRDVLDEALARYEADGWRVEKRTADEALVSKRCYGASFWEHSLDFILDFFDGSQDLPVSNDSTVRLMLRRVLVDDRGTVREQRVR